MANPTSRMHEDLGIHAFVLIRKRLDVARRRRENFGGYVSILSGKRLNLVRRSREILGFVPLY